METVINAALIYAALAWTGFSAWYMLRAKWWRTPFGWNTLGVSITLSAIFTLFTLMMAFPSFKVDLRAVGLGFYILIGLLGTHRIILLEREQRRQQ